MIKLTDRWRRYWNPPKRRAILIPDELLEPMRLAAERDGMKMGPWVHSLIRDALAREDRG